MIGMLTAGLLTATADAQPAVKSLSALPSVAERLSWK